MRCLVCGEPEGRCGDDYLESLLVPAPEPAAMSEYRSKEHVWGKDDLGRTLLVYAPGDPIPEDEARRQGLTKAKAKPAPDEHKAKPAPDETKKGPVKPPRRPARRRTI